MKRFTLLLVFFIGLIGIYSSVFSAPAQILELGNVINLMKSQSSLDIEVNYPGQAICGLRMVREDVAGAGTEIDQKMADIFKLKIRHAEGGFQQELTAAVVGHFVQGLAYELPKQGLFQYVIELSTASGRSLRADLIHHWKVSKKSFVGLIAVPCPIP